MLFVVFEEIIIEPLDGEGFLHVLQREVFRFVPKLSKATGGGAAGFVLSQEKGEAARGGLDIVDSQGVLVKGWLNRRVC